MRLVVIEQASDSLFRVAPRSALKLDVHLLLAFGASPTSVIVVPGCMCVSQGASEMGCRSPTVVHRPCTSVLYLLGALSEVVFFVGESALTLSSSDVAYHDHYGFRILHYYGSWTKKKPSCHMD